MRLRNSNSTLWLASAAAAALCAPAAAFAQAAPAPDEAGSTAATAVAQVVVTANRVATPADKVGQSVTVLTTSQIQQDQETSLSDILNRTPGINVVRNGGPGETTSVFIRGAESDQTVVLVDGVKINDPTDPGAGYDFGSLVTGDVSRIEVLRGPQSTLYGSEAIGGVVNIVTADATKPLEADLRVEGGSFGETYANGAVGGKEDKFDWRLSAYSNQAKSVPCFDEALGGHRPCAYHMDGFSGRFRYDLTPNLQFDQRAYYSWSRADFDGFDTPNFQFGDDKEYGHVQQWIDYTGINLSLFDGRLKNRLAYEYSAIDRNNQDPDQLGTTTTFVAHGRTSTVEYEGTFAIAPGWQAVFGAQSERASLFAWSPAFEAAPNSAHETINSGYGQVSGEVLPGLTLTGGARYDDQTRVGDHVTGQASAAWRLNGGNTILRTSFGQGFKAPSLYQLYSEYGNLGLRPEEANGWDLGVEQHFLDGRVIVQATYFGRETRNLIDFVSCFGVVTDPNNPKDLCNSHATSGGFYGNVDRAEAEGVELQGSWKATDRLTFSANYTYDDSEDRATGLQLARRPKNAANLDAGYEWPIKLRTDVAVRYAGDSWNDDAHTFQLKAYTLVDLRASYPLRDWVELYGRIENLADQHYETAYQYGTVGRAAYAGVRLKY